MPGTTDSPPPNAGNGGINAPLATFVGSLTVGTRNYLLVASKNPKATAVLRE
jgi:hypothetical protein